MVMVTNEKGGRQAKVEMRIDLIPIQPLLSLAACLHYGAERYGVDNWKKIEEEENLNHALIHIQQHRAGDDSEPHLINALARLFFATFQAQERGVLPYGYSNTSEEEVPSEGE